MYYNLPRKQRRIQRRKNKRRSLNLNLILFFCIVLAVVTYFIAPYYVFRSYKTKLKLRKSRKYTNINDIHNDIVRVFGINKDEFGKEPCLKNCNHGNHGLAQTLQHKCDLQLPPLTLVCLQHYWITSGCTSDSEDYPRQLVLRKTPWSKSRTITNFMKISKNAKLNKVEWILRNATAQPNAWYPLSNRDNNNIEEICEEAENGNNNRIATIDRGVDGEIVIDLEDPRADGWFKHHGNNRDDGSRPLYGQGPVIRKYYPYRCKGENNGLCKKGENSEASAVSIAENFDNKNSR